MESCSNQKKFAQNIQNNNLISEKILEVEFYKNCDGYTQNINSKKLEICKVCGESTQCLVNIPLISIFLDYINCRCEREKLEIQ